MKTFKSNQYEIIQKLPTWKHSKVTNMNTFKSYQHKNSQKLPTWKNSKVTNMKSFKSYRHENIQKLPKWKHLKVTNMKKNEKWIVRLFNIKKQINVEKVFIKYFQDKLDLNEQVPMDSEF